MTALSRSACGTMQQQCSMDGCDHRTVKLNHILSFWALSFLFSLPSYRTALRACNACFLSLQEGVISTTASPICALIYWSTCTCRSKGKQAAVAFPTLILHAAVPRTTYLLWYHFYGQLRNNQVITPHLIQSACNCMHACDTCKKYPIKDRTNCSFCANTSEEWKPL